MLCRAISLRKESFFHLRAQDVVQRQVLLLYDRCEDGWRPDGDIRERGHMAVAGAG